jgi:hypothetical protein
VPDSAARSRPRRRAACGASGVLKPANSRRMGTSRSITSYNVPLLPRPSGPMEDARYARCAHDSWHSCTCAGPELGGIDWQCLCSNYVTLLFPFSVSNCRIGIERNHQTQSCDPPMHCVSVLASINHVCVIANGLCPIATTKPQQPESVPLGLYHRAKPCPRNRPSEEARQWASS